MGAMNCLGQERLLSCLGMISQEQFKEIRYSSIFRNLVPDNLIRMTTHSAYIDYDITWALTNYSIDNGNITVLHEISNIERTLRYRAGVNTVGE